MKVLHYPDNGKGVGYSFRRIGIIQSVTYHGYDGFAIFARDMDMTLNNPCWNKLQAPWKASQEVAPAAAVNA